MKYQINRQFLLRVFSIIVAVFIVIFGFYNFIGIDASAKIGCRSPEDPNCDRCMIAPDNETCYALSASENSNWYNNFSGCSNSTETSILCASCLDRDESTLKQYIFINRFKQCDCNNISIGIDPGFNPNSCENICSRIKSLSQSCPNRVYKDGN